MSDVYAFSDAIRAGIGYAIALDGASPSMPDDLVVAALLSTH